ncbi:MAG: CBS domain-containing protein [candidate division Zixibacteria bacterium]|nr:CBS domain-containing protein [candidate division Zixibacteria bacterium]
MDTGIKVGDCMQSSLITITESASIFDAARKMKDSSVGSLLVEGTKGVYGIVTADDIVLKAVAADKMDSSVKKIASKPLISVAVDADLAEAAKMLGERDVKRLVVQSRQKIVGIISQKDIVRISPSLYDLIAEREHLRL